MAMISGTLSPVADISAHGKPTAGLAGAGAGLCDNGAHLVKVGFVTSTGISTLSAASDAVTVADKSTNGKIAVTVVASADTRVASVNIYMTKAGGSSYFLAVSGVANSNGATNVSVADTSLTVAAPTSDTGSAAGDSIVTASAGKVFRDIFVQNIHATAVAYVSLDGTGVDSAADYKLTAAGGYLHFKPGHFDDGTILDHIHIRGGAGATTVVYAIKEDVG